MPRLALYAMDLVAVCLLVFGLYLPRHRRRDLADRVVLGAHR